MSRLSFTQLLQDLELGIEKMLKLITESLDLFDQALVGNADLFNDFLGKIKTNDRTVRALGNDLEKTSMKILSLQAPVSKDLRFVLSSFRIIYDLERVSRDMYNSIQDMEHIFDLPEDRDFLKIDDLSTVSRAIRELVEIMSTLYSINRVDTDFDSLITKATQLDDIIDNFYELESKKFLDGNVLDVVDFASSFKFLSSFRSIERAGDHCCNVIERALYIQTGDRVEIK